MIFSPKLLFTCELSKSGPQPHFGGTFPEGVDHCSRGSITPSHPSSIFTLVTLTVGVTPTVALLLGLRPRSCAFTRASPSQLRFYSGFAFAVALLLGLCPRSLRFYSGFALAVCAITRASPSQLRFFTRASPSQLRFHSGFALAGCAFTRACPRPSISVRASPSILGRFAHRFGRWCMFLVSPGAYVSDFYFLFARWPAHFCPSRPPWGKNRSPK